MTSSLNYGAYLCAGATVTVRDELGDWTGHVLGISLRPGGEAEVRVLDPGTNPDRHTGQTVICTYRQLVPVPANVDVVHRDLYRRLLAERYGPDAREGTRCVSHCSTCSPWSAQASPAP